MDAVPPSPTPYPHSAVRGACENGLDCLCDKLSSMKACSKLSRWERVLFALLLMSIATANIAFFVQNLQRMYEASSHPVTQISQHTLTTFPDFAVTVDAWFNQVTVLNCTEGVMQWDVATSSFAWKTSWPCKLDKYPFGSGSSSGTVNIITPKVPFIPQVTNDATQSSLVNTILLTLDPRTCAQGCFLNTFDIDRYVNTAWAPPLSTCWAQCNGSYYVGMEVLVTQQLDNSLDYTFVPTIQPFPEFRFSPYMELHFSSNFFQFEATWTTYYIPFTWQDVVFAAASILSVSIAIINFVFPLRYQADAQFEFVARVSKQLPTPKTGTIANMEAV